jgi:bifunctional DNase/RNase
MKKIKLDIGGLQYSQTQSGAYALILVESGGKRQIPIVIGGAEAQSIALALENMKPERPLTHDLFLSFSAAFSIKVLEVIIYRFEEGIFYSKLICEQEEYELSAEIDSRTSDAIAIGLRFNCPIYTYENILSDTGHAKDDHGFDAIHHDNEFEPDIEDLDELEEITVAELENQLKEAIENEDYELASRIRDEINKRNA